MDDFEFRLGPFYDSHGDEIIPVGYEEVMEPLALVMGEYAVSRRGEHAEEARSRVLVTHYDLTAFIQQDWDRVMAGNSPRAFLMATRSGQYAAGRLAEEIVLEKLFLGAPLVGSKVAEVIPFWDACDRGLLNRPRGIGSDDAVLRLHDGRLVLVEAKATFRQTSYLRRSRPKIQRQLQATLEANPGISAVAAVLIGLALHTAALAIAERQTFLDQGLQWPDDQ